jgi:hypothetical protein
MKTQTLLVLIIVFSMWSCSSDDDNPPSFDINLLYAQWNFPYGCPNQNNLVFNEDSSYVLTLSGNSCEENIQNTWAYFGTYNISGNNLSFNQESEVIVEQGSNPQGFDTDGSELISQKIILIDETELFIERKFILNTILQDRNWLLTRQ